MKKLRMLLVTIVLFYSGVIFSQKTPFESFLADELISSTFLTKLSLTDAVVSEFITLKNEDSRIDQLEFYDADKEGKSVSYTTSYFVELVHRRMSDFKVLGDDGKYKNPYIRVHAISNTKVSNSLHIILTADDKIQEAIIIHRDKINEKATVIRLVGQMRMDEILELL